ncbi:DNA methyltransferase [Alteromonas sp. KUL42]|uniref:DNA cytosine methyltransferase n=1 Tax=Alteromonas sp. KUL42 TaxID=2480797 RepID=UPI001035701E|nr:DNA cytosine methyltransferase [Alteromonas sp. KUL42]TAP31756.1 DNA cytosine methyltransferase [Alteromonas sp. KUL42]GEA09193.1 DNA methyltransferase [Alteromonas sp. KUL42]
MKSIINTKIGISKGVPRIFIEGEDLALGVAYGDVLKYKMVETAKEKGIVLTRCEKNLTSGTKDENTVRVSKRTHRKTGKIKPLLELRDHRLAEFFGVGILVKISVSKGKLVVQLHSKDKEKVYRLKRGFEKLKAGEAFSVGSVFVGGGILDRALHESMSSAGVDTFCKFVIERESKYLDVLLSNQKDIFTEESIIVRSDVTDIDCSNVPEVEIFLAGIPCIASSKAGKTKNKLVKAEDHSDAGHLFFPMLNLIKASQPLIVVLECVPEYIQSSSYSVICSMLDSWGYDISVDVLSGNDYGCLEDRRRMCLVATTKGMHDENPFSLTSLEKHFVKEETLTEVLDNVDLDSDAWKAFEYLKVKEVRDAKEGKGFKRQLYDGSEDSVGTIRRLYHKGGSCDQYVCHPVNSSLSRLFTPMEHARLKKVPEKLVEGFSNTLLHEVLGQGVCFPVFYSVGFAIGIWLKNTMKWFNVENSQKSLLA